MNTGAVREITTCGLVPASRTTSLTTARIMSPLR